MKLHSELVLEVEGDMRIVRFGEADTDEELDRIFSLRYAVYSERHYIDPARFPERKETDDYDTTKKCRYFLAEIEGRVIGCVRIIFDDILPTEKYFTFSPPKEIEGIPRAQRAELGRFIVIPPDRDKEKYLPRNIVMLFIFDAVIDFGARNNILGGYAFVKEDFYKKLHRIRAPIHTISPYEQHYPDDGVISGYFNQSENPVLPCFFVTSEFRDFVENIMMSHSLFTKENEKRFVLRTTMYTDFLKKLHII